jgi:heme oxygenase
VAETVEAVAAPPDADETAEPDGDRSITELLEQLGRDVSALVFCEANLEASRHMPEVRRGARHIAIALVAAIAFLTAFLFANVAALDGLSTLVSDWLAALVLAAAWIVVGASLMLAFVARPGHVTGRGWRAFSAGAEETELEQARDDAAQAVRDSLGQLAPALSMEIASAAIGVADDVATEMVDAGMDLLEDSDDMVEAITEDLPGGGVVNLMWDVVLLPGRVGLKVAATVLKRTEPDT